VCAGLTACRIGSDLTVGGDALEAVRIRSSVALGPGHQAGLLCRDISRCHRRVELGELRVLTKRMWKPVLVPDREVSPDTDDPGCRV